MDYDEAKNGRNVNSLVNLAIETSRTLEAVWNEVGYGPDEKERQLEDLLQGFRRLCAVKIQEEESVRGQFLASVNEAQEAVKRFSSLLGVNPPEEYGKNVNLTEQLAHLECQVEELGARKVAAESAFAQLSAGIVELSFTLGEPLDPIWTDLGSNLTSAKLSEFEQKHLELEDALHNRCVEVSELVIACHNLIMQLKISEQEEATPLGKRILGSYACMQSQSENNTEFYHLAGYEGSDDVVGISFDALNELFAHHAELSEEVTRRKLLLQQMGEEILDFWQQLNVPVEEQEAFVKSVDGISMETIATGEAELNRLREAKFGTLSEFIIRERKKLVNLWKNMDMTIEQGKMSFPPYSIELHECHDSILEAHQIEVERLSSRIESLGPILDRIREREELCRERMAAMTAEKDPNRFKTRDFAQQKQLTVELEMEKRITKRLPKLTEYLQKVLSQWEEKQGEAFEFQGSRYLDHIDSSENAYIALRESQRKAKATPKKPDKYIPMDFSTPKRSGNLSMSTKPDSTRKVNSLPNSFSKSAHPRAPISKYSRNANSINSLNPSSIGSSSGFRPLRDPGSNGSLLSFEMNSTEGTTPSAAPCATIEGSVQSPQHPVNHEGLWEPSRSDGL